MKWKDIQRRRDEAFKAELRELVGPDANVDDLFRYFQVNFHNVATIPRLVVHALVLAKQGEDLLEGTRP